MKHIIKRLLPAICIIACFLSLTACGKAEDSAAVEVDPETIKVVEELASNVVKEFADKSDEQAEQAKLQAQKDKQEILAAGYDSWKSIKEDLGQLQSIDQVSVEVVDAFNLDFTARITANFEKRKLDATIGIASLQDDLDFDYSIVSFSPQYTTAEKMEKALMNTLMGMGTVFLVLIFISLLIGCFKYINAYEGKAKNAANVDTVKTPVVSAPAEEEEDLTDDLELVAVITAAIACAQGNSSTDGLVVRSIRRAPVSKWKKA